MKYITIAVLLGLAACGTNTNPTTPYITCPDQVFADACNDNNNEPHRQIDGPGWRPGQGDGEGWHPGPDWRKNISERQKEILKHLGGRTKNWD